MLETFELATTVPHEEECAQVGSENYSTRARQEVQAFTRQLLRIYGAPPEGALNPEGKYKLNVQCRSFLEEPQVPPPPPQPKPILVKPKKHSRAKALF